MRQNFQQIIAFFLSELLVEVKYRRFKLCPDLAIHHEAPCSRAFPVHRGQLKEVAAHHNLDSTERFVFTTHQPTHLVHHIKSIIMQHANLVDEQYVSLFNNLSTTFRHMIQKVIWQLVVNSDTCPRVNGAPPKVCCGQAGRRCDTHVLAIMLTKPNKLVQYEGFTRARWPGQQRTLPCEQNF